MTSALIKLLLSLAAVSIVYAFLCEIRLSRKARRLADWLQKVRPELWLELNLVARNWHGGHPGLKLLYRRNVVGLPRFDREYEQLHSLERRLVRGVVTGSMCLGLVILGIRFWGWNW